MSSHRYNFINVTPGEALHGRRLRNFIRANKVYYPGFEQYLNDFLSATEDREFSATVNLDPPSQWLTTNINKRDGPIDRFILDLQDRTTINQDVLWIQKPTGRQALGRLEGLPTPTPSASRSGSTQPSVNESTGRPKSPANPVTTSRRGKGPVTNEQSQPGSSRTRATTSASQSSSSEPRSIAGASQPSPAQVHSTNDTESIDMTSRNDPPRDGQPAGVTPDQMAAFFAQMVQSAMQSAVPATPAPGVESRSHDMSFKPQEVGYFHPNCPQSLGAGPVVYAGSDTFIRDVFVFIDRLRDAILLRDDRGERSVKPKIPQCLRGDALEWYTTALNPTEKSALRYTPGLELWETHLIKQFRPPIQDVMNALTTTVYSLEDARARKPIAPYVFGVIRNAKAAGIVDTTSQLGFAWNGLHALLRDGIPQPNPQTDVATFIRSIDDKRETWYGLSQIYISAGMGTMRRTQHNASQEGRRNGSGNRGRNGASDRGMTYSRYQQNRSANTQPATTSAPQPTASKPFYSGPALPQPTTRQPLAITNSTGRSNASEPNRPSESKGNASTFRPLRPFQANHAEADDIDATSEVEDAFQAGCDYAMAQFADQVINEGDERREPDEESAEESNVVATYFTEVRSTPASFPCKRCKLEFPSNNKLHDHVRSTCSKAHAKIKVAQPTPVIDADHRLITSTAVPPSGTGNDFRLWRYARVQASLTPDGPLHWICPDSGNPVTLIERAFFEANKGRATLQKMTSPVRVKGVGDALTPSDEYAVVDLYIPGQVLENGRMRSARAHIRFEAHVVESLSAKLLLGVDAVVPNGIIIDGDNKLLHVNRCRGLRAPIMVTAPPTNVTRTVLHTAVHTVVPGRSVVEVAVCANSVNPAAQETDCMFEPCFHNPRLGRTGGVYAHITNPGTRSVLIHNTASDPVTIPAHVAMGHLTPFNPDGVVEVHAAHHSLAADTAPLWQNLDVPDDRLVAFDPVRNRLEHTHVVNNTDTTTDCEQEATALTMTAPNTWKGAFGVTIWGTDEQAREVHDVVLAHKPLFTDDGKFVKVPEDDWMRIPLVSDWRSAGAKLNHRTYPLGLKEKQLVDDVFNKMHEQGKLEWSKGNTPFAFPVFVAWRNVVVDGKMVRKGRPVVDIRGLNKIARKDSYRIPAQQDVLARVRGMSHLSILDMTQYFYQFRVAKEDRHKLTVATHRGMEQFNVATMGFCGSPPYAQRKTDEFLRDTGCTQFAMGYIDDILAASVTFTEHQKHLVKLFSSLQSYDLTLSGSKAYLNFPSLILLGQRVDALGMYTAEDKIAAIRDLDFPENLAALELYIGMTNWLREYVGYFAQLLEPLQREKIRLLKPAPKAGYARAHYTKTVRVPRDREDLLISYQAIQEALSDPRFLWHFDHTRQVYAALDASKKRGYGVMMFHCKGDPQRSEDIKQKDIQPIVFLSKLLSSAERNYWPTELEVACLVWMVRKQRHMIDSAELPTIVFTDHAATVGIVRQTSLQTSSADKMNLLLIRASQYLSQFRLDLRYVPGRQNVVPDALSRLANVRDKDEQRQSDVLEDISIGSNAVQEELADMPVLAHYTTTIDIDGAFKTQLQEAYAKDKHWSSVMAMLEPYGDETNVTEAPIPYVKRKNLLYYVDSTDASLKLVIPKALQGDVFEQAHDQRFHAGFHRAYEAVRATYHVHRLAKHLEAYIKHCNICGLNQTRRHQRHGDLRPIQSPPIPFHTVAMDFVKLPDDEGKNMAMSQTDKYSKKINLVPGRDDWSGEEWSEPILDSWKDWGIPQVAIMDRDRKFIGAFWQGIFKRMGVKILMSTAYHPQTDGQSERTNQTFIIAMRFMLENQVKPKWVRKLPHIERVMNNSVNATTGRAPNEILYGFRLSEGLPVQGGPEDIVTQRELIRKEAADAIAYAQIKMKEQYDANHKPLHLKEGDLVYVRLHRGYKLPDASRKIGQQYDGPWMVKRLIGQNAAELDLPTHWKIHPVISIEYLELHNPDDPYHRPALPQPGPEDDDRNDENGEYYKVEALVDRRVKQNRKSAQPTVQYRVKWEGWSARYNQWINREEIDKDLVEAYDLAHPSERTQTVVRARGRPTTRSTAAQAQ